MLNERQKSLLVAIASNMADQAGDVDTELFRTQAESDYKFFCQMAKYIIDGVCPRCNNTKSNEGYRCNVCGNLDEFRKAENE